MSSKKTKKGSKSDKAKRNVQTVGKAFGIKCSVLILNT